MSRTSNYCPPSRTKPRPNCPNNLHYAVVMRSGNSDLDIYGLCNLHVSFISGLRPIQELFMKRDRAPIDLFLDKNANDSKMLVQCFTKVPYYQY